MASRTLIIGAAGAVGKELSRALKNAGSVIIAADRHEHLPSSIKGVASVLVGGVDVRDERAVSALIREHACPKTTVWNLAAPLSVETALSPGVAEAVTVKGMRNVLSAMSAVGCRRICFTDSIGSFGAEAPRHGVKASWLVANPGQDPGSDYGRQKRAVREMLSDFELSGGDPRFAVLPGVIHTQPVWGNGTTEYALDAIRAAASGKPFACPIDPDVVLPMIFVDDLMRGLVSLQFAKKSELREPQRGYNIPGLSFTANQLFHEIRQHVPGFETYQNINPDMNKFAKLWPSTLSAEEPLRDLEYEPLVSLPRMVAHVLNSHSARRLSNRAAFRSIDAGETGRIDAAALAKYVRKYLVTGRETQGFRITRHELVDKFVRKALPEMDADQDGRVTLDDFMKWSSKNSAEKRIQDLVDDFVATALPEMDVDNDGFVSLDDFMKWSWNNEVENRVDDFLVQKLKVQASSF